MMEMAELDDQLTRIAQKLRIVQQRPAARKAMGEREHGFHLGARLTLGQVVAFEEAHGVKLPSEYRAFLTRIGNGGAGPYYGILPLERWATAPLEYFEDERELPPDLLARDSPLRDGLTGVDWVELLGGAPRPHFDPKQWHPYQGTITIGRLGATYYALLVVSGVTRGRICSVDLDMQAPKFAAQRGFLDWYEAWLDDALSGKDLGAFGS
jgi:hypothetical protein